MTDYAKFLFDNPRKNLIDFEDPISKVDKAIVAKNLYCYLRKQFPWLLIYKHGSRVNYRLLIITDCLFGLGS